MKSKYQNSKLKSEVQNSYGFENESNKLVSNECTATQNRSLELTVIIYILRGKEKGKNFEKNPRCKKSFQS